jgi:hypothetical protein
VWVEYAGPVQIIRCTFDTRRGHLTADALNDAEWINAVDVETGSVRSQSELLERLDQFADELRRFVRSG